MPRRWTSLSPGRGQGGGSTSAGTRFHSQEGRRGVAGVPVGGTHGQLSGGHRHHGQAAASDPRGPPRPSPRPGRRMSSGSRSGSGGPTTVRRTSRARRSPRPAGQASSSAARSWRRSLQGQGQGSEGHAGPGGCRPQVPLGQALTRAPAHSHLPGSLPGTPPGTCLPASCNPPPQQRLRQPRRRGRAPARPPHSPREPWADSLVG